MIQDDCQSLCLTTPNKILLHNERLEKFIDSKLYHFYTIFIHIIFEVTDFAYVHPLKKCLLEKISEKSIFDFNLWDKTQASHFDMFAIVGNNKNTISHIWMRAGLSTNKVITRK